MWSASYWGPTFWASSYWPEAGQAGAIIVTTSNQYLPMMGVGASLVLCIASAIALAMI